MPQAAASNSTLSVLQKAKKAREHPKPRQKVNESIVEADNITEVDASEDIDFVDVDVDVDVDDVAVDVEMGPDLFRMISAMMMNYCPIWTHKDETSSYV